LLSPQQRQRLALDALTGLPVSDLACRHGVSRQFVYRQKQLAQDALDRAFAPAVPADQEVLFYLPVTRAWLRQLVLALVLLCHSPLRGVGELLRDLFDFPLSLGTIHNIVKQAIAKATSLNSRQDLSRVLIAAPDEIFQGRSPILIVVDVASTYCCLLAAEEHRDGDTWGIRLLELHDQGFNPLATIGDGGQGWRCGVKQSLDVPCRDDLFHDLRDAGQDVRFLENRAYAAISTCDKLHRKNRSKKDKADDAETLDKRQAAQREQQRAVALADDVALLVSWLRQDVLAVAGPRFEQRQELFDFVLAELQMREPSCPHRLGPLCSSLENHKPGLLAFAQEMDQDISSLALYAQVAEEVVREMVAVQEMPQQSAARWRRDAQLHKTLRERYHELSELVEELRGKVVRASSVVENLNSRLRNYFFLRKEVGQGYLELLRFFLNHRRFMRSEHAERVGKSPAELLSGEEHGHWLEMLGYQLFRRAA
jgi:hypothetical protein